MSDDQTRRVTDVEPAVQLYVQQEVADTRHKLANEIAAVGVKVDNATNVSTREHAEVAAKLDQLSRDVVETKAALQPLRDDVTALKQKDAEESAAAAAVDRLRRQQRWIAAFAVAAVPVALALAPHVH